MHFIRHITIVLTTINLLISCPSVGQDIVINEIMSVNSSTVLDDYGQYEDWVELYNKGEQAVNLKGYGLSEDPTVPFKWTFSDVIIQPGQYLLVWASGRDITPEDGWINGLMQNVYSPVEGYSIKSLINHPSFPHKPSESFLLSTAFDAPANTGDAYGLQLHGYIKAPETGKYTFWIASDDEGELFLSPDDNPLKAVSIAAVPGWARHREWGKYPEQKSVPVFLEEGKMYYINALMKEDEGGDHLEVSWKIPSGVTEAPIHNRHLYWKGGDVHTSFAISSQGEELVLTNPDGVIVDYVSVPELPVGISFGRYPDAGNHWEFFSTPTPGGANTTNSLSGILAPPFFSSPGGFYKEEFEIFLYHNVPDVEIYYTLDGSEPDPHNLNGNTYQYKSQYRKEFAQEDGPLVERSFITYLYNSAIPIKDNTAIKESQTVVSSVWEQSPVNPLAIPRMGTVVRAKAFKQGFLPSETVSSTYIIRDDLYPLPVISLVLPEKSFFSWYDGIYVPGKTFDDWRTQNWDKTIYGNSPGNFKNSGLDWERETNVEVFDPTGLNVINQRAGVRIHGGWSRSNAQKSLRLYAKTEYGRGEFNYKFFPDKDTDVFKRIVLRATEGENYYTFFRDDMVHRLVRHRLPDIQEWQPSATYLNGEYWGLLNIRDRIDNYYLAYKYNIDPNKVDILTSNSSVKYGDNYHYQDLLNYVRNKDLSKSDDYDYVKTLMDIENFADYYAVEIYANNQDWPQNNVDYWRYKTDGYNPDAPYGLDGRWRWILFDVDAGFGAWGKDADSNTLLWVSKNDWSTDLFKALLKNQDFRYKMINRFADLMNSCFHPDTVSNAIDVMTKVYEPVIDEHILRWNKRPSRTNWYNEIEKMRTFALERPAYMKSHVQDFFGLKGNYKINLSTGSGKGAIKVSTVLLDNPSGWEGTYFNGVPVELVAIPAPNYRFSRWEGFVESSSDTISVVTESDIELVAHFEPTEQPVLVNFWLFNSSLPNDTPIEELNDSYHLSNVAKLSFQSALPGYPYSPGHPLWRKASMERRNLPTPVNYRPEANNNIIYQETSVHGLQVRQPFATENGENTLIFHLPSSGFKNLTFSFAARNENAAEHLLIDYCTDPEGLCWNTAGLSQSQFPLFNEYKLYTINFGSCDSVDDNSHFRIRIRFRGNNITADNGGRVTFNNISLDGIPIPGNNQAPDLLSAVNLTSCIEGGAPVSIDLSTLFSDPEGDIITFSAQSTQPGFVQPSVEGSFLQLTPLLTGDAVIKVMADDGHNPPREHSFRVIVFPAAHVLSEGEFSFLQWDKNTPEHIYPANMMFLQSDAPDPGISTPLVYPYHISHNDYHTSDQSTIGFPYNNTGRTRINGLDEEGISFINTGRNRDVGGALVALNTIGMQSVKIRWSGGTISRGEKLYALRLQYRVGTEGPFADVVHVGMVSQYMAGADGEFVEFPAVSLPSQAAGKEYVQLLWRYYHINGESGNRSQLRLDDIVIGDMLSDDAYITSFSFKDVEPLYLSIDNHKKIIKVGVESSTNITGLIPVLAVSEAATISPAPAGIDYNPMDFTTPVVFVVTSQSGRIVNNYTVVADNRVGVEEEYLNQVTVYPNPASLSVKVSSSSMMQMIDVLDISGLLMKRYIQPSATQTVSVADYPPGIYFIRVYTATGVYVSKLQVIR